MEEHTVSAHDNPDRGVGRFAPSPTGNLHLGTLVAALGSWLQVRHKGGRWLIRVDDIDPAREHPGSAQRIVTGLARCGLIPDAPVLYQSTRLSAYQRALDALREQGHVFECWCSRRDLADAGEVHRDGQCLRGQDPERPPTLRLKVPPGVVGFEDRICGPQQQDVREEVGDFVLRRADGCWSYHLACAVDEAHQGITEVVRGHDLLDSTPRQILIQRLLGLPSPDYGHLPLVLGTDGEKLSKSGNGPVLDLHNPVAALNAALAHLGQSSCLRDNKPLDVQLADAARAFDLSSLAKQAHSTVH